MSYLCLNSNVVSRFSLIMSCLFIFVFLFLLFSDFVVFYFSCLFIYWAQSPFLLGSRFRPNCIRTRPRPQAQQPRPVGLLVLPFRIKAAPPGWLVFLSSVARPKPYPTVGSSLAWPNFFFFHRDHHRQPKVSLYLTCMVTPCKLVCFADLWQSRKPLQHLHFEYLKTQLLQFASLKIMSCTWRSTCTRHGLSLLPRAKPDRPSAWSLGYQPVE